MAILNYTTQIQATKTLAEIQQNLASHGARGVMIEYRDAIPTLLAFVIATAHGERKFVLPANAEAVFRTLEKQNRKGNVPRRLATREQAARVAWRIIKDWVEAQLAIVEAGLATLDQVMLPYMIVRGGRTMYESMVESRMALTDESGRSTTGDAP